MPEPAPVAAPEPPPPPPPSPGELVVSTARSQIGTPYAYASCSPEDGYDCSGLVWWVYRQNGVELPRTSGGILSGGRPVAKNALEPGDVVVFDIGRKGKELHVGIWTGDATFVHSPRSGETVREEPIDMTYWRRRYIGARRYLPDPAPAQGSSGLPDSASAAAAAPAAP
ncbi:C40 family peptidase [Desulfovibrio sp. X2]|uniref:C40 family peptidase n=1 Tax=Desulfovibrio sp. X2 TaxID=941449 RepID=UPI00068EE4F9|nr:C40 family peptidase [Desulfovibrio sp. X2]